MSEVSEVSGHCGRFGHFGHSRQPLLLAGEEGGMGAVLSSSIGTLFQQFVVLIDWGFEHSPEQPSGCRLKTPGSKRISLIRRRTKTDQKIKIVSD